MERGSELFLLGVVFSLQSFCLVWGESGDVLEIVSLSPLLLIIYPTL